MDVTIPSPIQPGDPELPSSLQAELTRLAGAPAGLDRFDAAVAAQAHFSRVRRQRRVRWASAALAASLLVGAFVTVQINLAGRSPAPANAGLAGDLNHDGIVDMLDALLLAKHVAQGDADASWDFNRDQRVDRSDADTIARVAVDLKGGRL